MPHERQRLKDKAVRIREKSEQEDGRGSGTVPAASAGGCGAGQIAHHITQASPPQIRGTLTGGPAPGAPHPVEQLLRELEVSRCRQPGRGSGQEPLHQGRGRSARRPGDRGLRLPARTGRRADGQRTGARRAGRAAAARPRSRAAARWPDPAPGR
ncbi:DUF6381 family protein [Streptomyces sp. NPDC090741]|uniref:DUF6381 family protein n=1 Tax=Streptomyces sp. NPDC090741 TaxID=3365967 RepID=UPI0037FAB0AB